MKNTIIKDIIIYICLCGVVYLLFAFGAAEINSAKWSDFARYICACAFFFLSLAIIANNQINKL